MIDHPAFHSYRLVKGARWNPIHLAALASTICFSLVSVTVQADDYSVQQAPEDLLEVLEKNGIAEPEFIVVVSPDAQVNAFATREVAQQGYLLEADRLLLPVEVVEEDPVLSTDFDTAVIITDKSPWVFTSCKKKSGQNDCDTTD